MEDTEGVEAVSTVEAEGGVLLLAKAAFFALLQVSLPAFSILGKLLNGLHCKPACIHHFFSGSCEGWLVLPLMDFIRLRFIAPLVPFVLNGFNDTDG